MKPLTLFKSSLLLACISFFISQNNAYGQREFKGFYVSKNGDTVFGNFLNYTQWIKNPKEISFMPDGRDASVLLKPGDVSTFSINNFDTYISKEISRMTNVIHIGNIGLSIPPEYKEVDDVYENLHVFLREVYNSSALKLYEFSDAKRTNYFVLEHNGKFTELQFKAFYNKDDKPVYVRNYQIQLQNMLASLLEGRPALERKIFFVDYDAEALVKYLDKVMNKKTASDEKEFRPEIAISVGGLANFFEIGPRDQRISITRTKFDPKASPLFSVSFIHYFQRNLGKVFLNPHLKYYSIEQVGIAPYEYINNLAYHPDTVTVRLKDINLDLFLGKSWIKTDNFSWYTSIGPSVHFLLENSYAERKPFVDSEKQTGPGFHISFAAETGIVVNKKFGLWICYSYLADVQKKVQYHFRATNIQAGLQYRFSF